MNWKTPVTMVVLILMLVAGTVVGWHYATQDVPSLRDAATADEPKTQCRTYDSGQALEVSAVTVNVYNTPEGLPNLAGTTMQEFIARGFVGGVAENSEQKVPGRRVLIIAENPTSAQVRLVRKHLKGKVVTRGTDDPDMGGAVNVYVGQRFKGLRDKGPNQVKVRGSQRVCFEVDE
jgi:hypothetical protein